MIYFDTVWHYEVLAYSRPERLELGPDKQETLIMRKSEAMKIARGYAKRYKRVEVLAVEVDADDSNNLLGDELVAAWENGRKTA